MVEFNKALHVLWICSTSSGADAQHIYQLRFKTYGTVNRGLLWVSVPGAVVIETHGRIGCTHVSPWRVRGLHLYFMIVQTGNSRNNLMFPHGAIIPMWCAICPNLWLREPSVPNGSIYALRQPPQGMWRSEQSCQLKNLSSLLSLL